MLTPARCSLERTASPAVVAVSKARLVPAVAAADGPAGCPCGEIEGLMSTLTQPTACSLYVVDIVLRQQKRGHVKSVQPCIQAGYTVQTPNTFNGLVENLQASHTGPIWNELERALCQST